MTDEESAAHAVLSPSTARWRRNTPARTNTPRRSTRGSVRLEMAMEYLEQRPLIYDPVEVGRAGVFVTLDRDGSLAIYRGYVRPEDEPREETAVQDGDGVDATGRGMMSVFRTGNRRRPPSGAPSSLRVVSRSVLMPTEEDDDGALKPLPERLVMELTAHRTLALREAIGRSPDVALTLLLLKLVTDTFRTSSATGSCLEASVRHVYMSAQAPDLKDSVVAKLVDERHAAWEAICLLAMMQPLWDYLSVLDQGSRLALLAHCLSFGINALHEKVNPYGAGISASGLTRRMAHADLVARAVDLDMVEAGWEPTVDGYLNRVPKARSSRPCARRRVGTAQLLDHLKKGEMATEAERLLKGDGWLPEVLRGLIWRRATAGSSQKGRGKMRASPKTSISRPS